MKGRNRFTKSEIQEIEQLLREKSAVGPDKQVGIRGRLRDRFGFYLTDHPHDDLRRLVAEGLIAIVDDRTSRGTEPDDTSARDEDYVIGICNQVLGADALRQHRFRFQPQQLAERGPWYDEAPPDAN